jgi:hypothetical protein
LTKPVWSGFCGQKAADIHYNSYSNQWQLSKRGQWGVDPSWMHVHVKHYQPPVLFLSSPIPLPYSEANWHVPDHASAGTMKLKFKCVTWKYYELKELERAKRLSTIPKDERYVTVLPTPCPTQYPTGSPTMADTFAPVDIGASADGNANSAKLRSRAVLVLRVQMQLLGISKLEFTRPFADALASAVAAAARLSADDVAVQNWVSAQSGYGISINFEFLISSQKCRALGIRGCSVKANRLDLQNVVTGFAFKNSVLSHLRASAADSKIAQSLLLSKSSVVPAAQTRVAWDRTMSPTAAPTLQPTSHPTAPPSQGHNLPVLLGGGLLVAACVCFAASARSASRAAAKTEAEAVALADITEKKRLTSTEASPATYSSRTYSATSFSHVTTGHEKTAGQQQTRMHMPEDEDVVM